MFFGHGDCILWWSGPIYRSGTVLHSSSRIQTWEPNWCWITVCAREMSKVPYFSHQLLHFCLMMGKKTGWYGVTSYQPSASFSLARYGTLHSRVYTYSIVQWLQYIRDVQLFDGGSLKLWIRFVSKMNLHTHSYLNVPSGSTYPALFINDTCCLPWASCNTVLYSTVLNNHEDWHPTLCTWLHTGCYELQRTSCPVQVWVTKSVDCKSIIHCPERNKDLRQKPLCRRLS